MVIRKIFEGVFDEEVHSDFLRFGKGEYKDKYLIEAKRQKGKWVIKTSSEFANFFVRKCLEGIEEELNVSGCIVSTLDLSNEIRFSIDRVKNFQGVKQILVNTKVSPKDILGLMDKFPRVFFALSFSVSDSELKILAKPPKSSKPKTKEEAPKANFCTLKTLDESIVRELFFDVGDFNEIRVSHRIRVDDIVYPKDERDPKVIRENSKRKGVLIREIEVDSEKKIFEKGFEA